MPFYAKAQPSTGVPRFMRLAPSVKIQGVWKPAKQAWVKVAGLWKQFYLAGGVRDSNFNPNSTTYNLDGSVEKIVIQPDGKILLGGILTSFNGTPIKHIVRLNADQTLDTTFNLNIGSGPNSRVNAITIQSDGKILVGGSFFAFNGQSSRLVRLNSDGTRDMSFPANIGFGTVLPNNGNIYSIVIQSDGKIVLAGDFQGVNAQSEKNIIRLNADGTIDTQFLNNIGTGVVGAGASVDIKSLGIQSDGKILLGGNFTTFNGTTVNRLARLNTDGTLDTTFTSNIGTGFNQAVLSIAVQQDDKIVLAGRFETFKGTASEGLIRLNSDGTLDTAFASNIGIGLSYYANDVKIQSDGKIVVGGNFQSINNSFSQVNNILRLNSDGTRDTTVPVGSKYGADGDWVNALAIAANGDIFIAGSFQSFNILPAINFAKLNSSLTFTNTGTNGTVRAIGIMPWNNGPIIGGSFTLINKDRVAVNNLALLNPDGTLNTSTGFNTNIGSGPNGTINAIVNSGSYEGILIAGSFTSFNGVSVGRVVRLSIPAIGMGGLNTTFNNNLGTGANAEITSAFIDRNLKYVIAGNFTSFNNVSRGRLVGLNSDGTPNTSFNTNIGSGANGNITCMASAQGLQGLPYGIICGDFTSFNGVTTNKVAMFSEYGLETSFSTNIGSGPNGVVRAVAAAQDRFYGPGPAFVLGGDFTLFKGVYLNRLVGLDSNGALNTTFNNNTGTGANGPVTSILFLKNGQILVGGEFSSFNGFQSKQLVRLNKDGTIDTSFTSNFGLGIGPGSSTGFTSGQERVNSMIQQNSDEEVLVGGKFVTFNGADSSSVARIGGDFAS
jgi:uncharacterized delta-60 repeat protein